MPIELISKISPKSDGFVGMVDADQVIGASGAGGYLPSSTISGNSLQEYQLKISNSPSDGYFLQYKDSTDKLTWAETSTTDVAWSGASEFYPVSSLVHALNIWYSNSSNKYSKAYISTSTGVFALSTHSHDEFGLWSGASEYISVSSNVNTLLNWYSNSSSKLSNAYASASIALYSETYSSEDDLTSALNDNYANSGAFHSHIINEDNPHNVVWADVETGAKDDLADDYYPSSLGNSLSDSVTSHIGDSSIHFTKSSIDDDYAGSGAFQSHKNNLSIHNISGTLAQQHLLISGSKYHSAYISASTGVFALATHSHGEFEAWSGATGYITVSSMVNILDTWYDNSSQKLSNWYASSDNFGTVYNWYLNSSNKLSASGALAHPRVTLTGESYISINDQQITADKLDLTETNATAGLGITFSTNEISVTDYAASAQLKTKLDAKYDSTSDVEVALGGTTISSNAKSGKTHADTTTGNPHSIDLTDIGESKGTLSATAPITVTSDRQVFGGAATIAVDTATPNAGDTTHLSTADQIYDYIQIVSGALDTKIGAVGGLTGDTVSSNFFLKTSGQSIWNWYSASGVNLYQISTNLDSKIDGKQDVLDGSEYYPSSLGHNQYLEYVGHSSNTNNPHEVAWSDVSTAAIADLNDNYAGSSNINRSLLDSISSNLRTDINAASDTPTNWTTLTAGTGFEVFEGSIGVSGSTGVSLDIAGYTTISSQTKSAYNWTNSVSGSYLAYPSSVGHNLNVAFWGHSGQSNKHIDWTVDQGDTNIHTGNYTNTTYTAGSLLDLDGTTFNVDLTELTDGTSDIVGSEDEIVYLDNGVQKRKLVSEWTLSDFNNDSGWTTNTGTVDTSGTPVKSDFAKFTDSNTIEGRSCSEVILDLGVATNNLNNLGTVSINTSIISDTDNTDDLGSLSKRWRTLYTYGVSSSNGISSQVFRGIAPMTYSIANIMLSANQNINLGRFKCPTGKKAYIYQANACGSGGTGIGDLYVEVLAGSSLPLYGADTIYKTSSATLQQGNPLASSDAGDYIEIRFMYSGNTTTPEMGAGYRYGTAMIQVGVYSSYESN